MLTYLTIVINVTIIVAWSLFVGVDCEKRNSMKKRGLVFFCVMLSVLMLLMQGCGVPDKDATEDTNGNSTTQESGNDDYQVEIIDCKKDDYGYAVYVTCLFTNNSEEEMAFYRVFSHNVYQNGVGLTEMTSDVYSNVKSGVSAEVTLAYVLRDKTAPIEVEIRSGLNPDYVVRKTFTLE